jgi:hypothetical protein
MSFDTTDAFDTIDVLYYINLDKRTDRRAELEGEFRRMNIPASKIVRISAVAKPKAGALGCSMSHCIALERFIASGHSTCCIFEDDFEFTADPWTVRQTLLSLATVPFDVCMISGYVKQSEPTAYPSLERILNAQTASGYIVSRAFAPTLLRNFREGVPHLEAGFRRTGAEDPPYCVDQYWKRLQPPSRWYITIPKLGKQRASYSDIEQKKVSYTV